MGEKLLPGQAGVVFDLLNLLLEGLFADISRPATGLCLVEGLHLGGLVLELPVGVFTDHNELLQHLLLEEKLHKKLFHRLLQLLQLIPGALPGDAGAGFHQAGIGLVGLVLRLVQLANEPLESGHVLFPTFDLLVLDDPVKTFAGVEQLLTEGDIFPGDETKFMEMLNRADFRLLDPLGNLHLLLPGEQRHLPHLAQIHPDRIVEDIQFLGFLLDHRLAGFLVPCGFFITINFAGLDDIDLEIPQEDEHALDLFGLIDRLRQGLVQIVKREVALFPGQLDQLPQLLLLFRALGQTSHAVGGGIGSPVNRLFGLLLHRHQLGLRRFISRPHFRRGGRRNFRPTGRELRGLGSFAFGDFLHPEKHSQSTNNGGNINIKN